MSEKQDMRALFALVADTRPAETPLDTHTRWRRDEVMARIRMGQNAFRLWRRHHGAPRSAVAQALGISQRDYALLERDCHEAQLQDVTRFCRFFRLQPLDLVNDVDVMPTAVAQALAARVKDRRLGPVTRAQVCARIVREIALGAGIVASLRAGMPVFPGAGDVHAPAAKALDLLRLNNPTAAHVKDFEDVYGMMARTATAWDMLVEGSMRDYHRLTKPEWREARAQAQRHQEMLDLWVRINPGQDNQAGPMLDRHLRAYGIEMTAALFMLGPETYGVKPWHWSERHLIGGRIYDWGQATERFFGLLGVWTSYCEACAEHIALERVVEAQVRHFDDWMGRRLVQDAAQAFTNVCVFARSCRDVPDVAKALQAFEFAPCNDILKRVFKPSAPC